MKFVLKVESVETPAPLYFDNFVRDGMTISLVTGIDFAFEFSEYGTAQTMADFLNENSDFSFHVVASS